MGWSEVGDALRTERNRRGLTRAQFGARIGLGVRVIGSLERGSGASYSPETIDRVELALGWHPGSVDSVVGGGAPTVVEDVDLARIRAVWHRLPLPLRKRLAETAETFAGIP